MTKYKLEYIWLDGKTPVPGLRGKTLLNRTLRILKTVNSVRKA